MEQPGENVCGTKSEYNARTESNGKRDSNAERKTPEEEAGTRAGNLAREHNDERSCDRCDKEERRELTRDRLDDDLVDPERVKAAKQVDDGAR